MRVGRPEVDDKVALGVIREIMDEDPGLPAKTACGLVAVALKSPGWNSGRAAERLRKKLRAASTPPPQ